MKALNEKRPLDKNSGIRETEDGYMVDVHIRTSSGKRFRRRKYGVKTMVEARKIRASFYAAYNAEQGITVDNVKLLHDGPTISELAEECLEKVWPNEAPRTVEHYKSKLKNHILPVLGEVKVKEVRPKMIKDFLLHMVDHSGLKVEGVKHTKNTLSSMFSAAVDLEYIDANPVAGVKMAWQKLKDKNGEVKKDVRVLTESEIDRLIAAAAGTPIYYMVLFQASMGLRMGEALALTDENFENGVCKIRHQIKRREGKALGLEPLKTQSSRRDIPVPDDVLEAIRGFKGKFTESGNGNWLENRRACVLFNEVREKAGIDVGSHTFRHTLCSRLLNDNGIAVEIVKEILGHSSINTTLSFYSHASSAQMKAAMNSLGSRKSSHLSLSS